MVALLVLFRLQIITHLAGTTHLQEKIKLLYKIVRMVERQQGYIYGIAMIPTGLYIWGRQEAIGLHQVEMRVHLYLVVHPTTLDFVCTMEPIMAVSLKIAMRTVYFLLRAIQGIYILKPLILTRKRN